MSTTSIRHGLAALLCLAALSCLVPGQAWAACTNASCQQLPNFPWCDTQTGFCEECISNAHCISNGWTGYGGQPEVICKSDYTCTVCTANYQCGADYCKNPGTDQSHCVNCLDDNHCTNRYHPICQPNGSCEACGPGPSGDDECFAKSPEFPRCSGGECVECVDDDDCAMDELCDGNSCSPQTLCGDT